MSDVLHSAGEPGAARCSETASGSTPQEQRIALGLQAAYEIEALAATLVREAAQEREEGCFVVRGLALRIEELGCVVMWALSPDSEQNFEEHASTVHGQRRSALGGVQ